MRSILFAASLFSILLVPHFSYAVDNAVSDVVAKHHSHHAIHHRANQLKSDNTKSVDVNHADVAQLTTLKGVGVKRAANIIAYRQVHGSFQTVSDLSKVKGVGVKGLARLENNNPGRITVNSSENLK